MTFDIRLRRRHVLQAALAGGAVLASASGARAATTRPRRAVKPLGSTGVTLRWLGVAGWELAFDGHVLWFDPYLSRFDPNADGGALRVRADVIEGLLADGRLAGPPEVLMVSHGHYDHLNDVPYLLNRPQWQGATIHTLGTETTRHLLNGMGYDGPVVEVSGGEVFTFAGGAYTIEVIRSLHSQSQTYGFPFPGTLTATPPAAPATVADLLEGGTVSYLVTIPDRLSVLLSGATNFIERELDGVHPDVATVAMTFHNALDRYVERLLTVLGGPAYVLPCHHDDMVTGYDDPNLPNTIHTAAVTELQQAVRTLKLTTRVVAPAHLTDIAF